MKPIILDILVKANRDLGFSFNESDAHDMYLVFKKYEDEKESILKDLLKALNPRSVDFEKGQVGIITSYVSGENEIDKAIIRAIKITNHKPKG